MNVQEDDRYFYHARGCGSGSTKCLVKLSKTDEVTVQFSDDWMGREALRWTLDGKVLPVNGHVYSVYCFNELGIYLDAFHFETALATEWGQELPIGLYCGNGCYCTEEFQLVLVVNRMASQFDAEFEKRFQKISGMKLQQISSREYENLMTQNFSFSLAKVLK